MRGERRGAGRRNTGLLEKDREATNALMEDECTDERVE